MQPVLDVLAKDTGDIRICPRLTLEHVSVKGAGRQKVKPAARLFSHNVSEAVREHGGRGASATSWVLKLGNDWFDVFNSQILRKDSRKRTHAFGLQLEVQMEIFKTRPSSLVRPELLERILCNRFKIEY